MLLAVNAVHNESLLESVKKISNAAHRIENQLGFRLKLTQFEEDEHLWQLNFIFDNQETKSDRCISIQLDQCNHVYKCNYFYFLPSYALTDTFVTLFSFFLVLDMKPKPEKFNEIEQYLLKTNDITGFFVHANKFFNKKHEKNDSDNI